MYEFTGVRQHPGGFRRLFMDGYFDLYLWYDAPGGTLTGFQLVYDKGRKERALTWRIQGGFAHDAVDTGDGQAYNNPMTPILVADGAFDKDGVLERFRAASEGMEEGLRAFLIERLAECRPEAVGPSA